MRSVFRHLGVLVALALTVCVAPGASAAAGAPVPSADLAGAPIALADVGSYYCHDLNYPRIHCFARAQDLEVSLALVQATQMAQPLGATSAQYLKLFDLSGYAGVYIYLSANYNDLGVIGWNDRVSSYVGVNSLAFGMWTNVNMTGNGLLGCCNQHAATLPSLYDNQISSASIR